MVQRTLAKPPDLPEPGVRWVASRKEAVLENLARGRITKDEVLRRYPDLSSEELTSWQQRFKRAGREGLLVTKGSPENGSRLS